MVARQLSEPRTANWIASEADWSHGPTTRVLKRLVDDGVRRRDDSGAHTTYYPDYRRQAMQAAMRLRDGERTVAELTERLAELTRRMGDWADEFGVETPNQLRATIAAAELAPEDVARRRDVARDWEQLQRRSRIVGFAIREWDFLAPDDAAAEASDREMAVPHPGGDPNVTLYQQPTRDVLERVPHIKRRDGVSAAPDTGGSSSLHSVSGVSPTPSIRHSER